MPKLDNIIGSHFGRWTVVSRDCGRKWVCRCDCGNVESVDGSSLRNGRSKSCGCLRSEITSVHRSTHGMARSGKIRAEWAIWSMMRQRCNNRSNSSYDNYGGRGIVVCERWNDSFEAFYSDMGPRPSDRHTIERIDNDGPYSPENCRWATRKEQSRNTRRTKMLRFNGRTLCISDWGAVLGIDPGTIAYRLSNGWSTTRALSTPVAERQ